MGRRGLKGLRGPEGADGSDGAKGVGRQRGWKLKMRGARLMMK